MSAWCCAPNKVKVLGLSQVLHGENQICNNKPDLRTGKIVCFVFLQRKLRWAYVLLWAIIPIKPDHCRLPSCSLNQIQALEVQQETLHGILRKRVCSNLSCPPSRYSQFSISLSLKLYTFSSYNILEQEIYAKIKNAIIYSPSYINKLKI